MYSFIDVNEYQRGKNLPSEAMSINGRYIENEIEGYRTLQVEGRELLETEVSDFQIGFQSGSKYQDKEIQSVLLRFIIPLPPIRRLLSVKSLISLPRFSTKSRRNSFLTMSRISTLSAQKAM